MKSDAYLKIRFQQRQHHHEKSKLWFTTDLIIGEIQSLRARLGNRAGTATIALARPIIGIGKVFSSLIHSVTCNPSLAKQLFGYAILGFALTEAIALFAPVVYFGRQSKNV
ncbi:hypothetical protein POM88_024033 [Heracleum sosnowskyi]|uniref:ATP synthase subunit 9, mitochondrial n=1 Tax=Heracleum sosnowskyi TaxID=360622 RepID=A0AAD8MWI3_9APIA|nr:hypothetical protein POM88_024033 [Heracleum sosnowskyi]